MCSAAFHFGPLDIPKIVQEGAALCFNDQIKPLAQLVFDEHSPVGVVRAKRCRNLKPPRQLRIDFDGGELLHRPCEGRFVFRVVNDMIVDGFLCRDHVLQVADQLFGSEQLLGEVVFVAYSLVLDAAYHRLALGTVDCCRRDLDELGRIDKELIQASAVDQDAVDAAPS